jgi:hypothetical protein
MGRGTINVGGKTELAARIAFELFNGPITNGALVLHSCDNKICVNPEHLFLGTNQKNSSDMVSKNRQHAKLNADLVRHIRSSKESCSALARKLEVDGNAISRIRRGLTWTHVT